MFYANLIRADGACLYTTSITHVDGWHPWREATPCGSATKALPVYEVMPEQDVLLTFDEWHRQHLLHTFEAINEETNEHN